jgi:hypothetical protein
MKQISAKTVYKYLCDQLTGNFTGFLIGASATGLVSQFFETRSLKNLWGLRAQKTVVDKETFQELEWIISIVVGFIFFEIATKVFKEYLSTSTPQYKLALFKYIIRNGLQHKFRNLRSIISERGTVFFSAFHIGLRQAFNKYSKRG